MFLKLNIIDQILSVYHQFNQKKAKEMSSREIGVRIWRKVLFGILKC